jgi:hypothetical protein
MALSENHDDKNQTSGNFLIAFSINETTSALDLIRSPSNL